jgi:hypothetical protein
MNPRSALAASAAPVPAPVIVVVAGAVLTVVLLDERHAARLLITNNPTINFFMQTSPVG